MIPLPGIRDKGSGPQLGARHPGETGPFGPYGTDEDDDGLDDEQHDDKLPAATVAGQPTERT